MGTWLFKNKKNNQHFQTSLQIYVAMWLHFVYKQIECDLLTFFLLRSGWNVDVAIHHPGPDGTGQHLRKVEQDF